MEKTLSVVLASRNSRRVNNPLRVLAMALIVGVSANAWCAPDVAPKTSPAKSVPQKVGGVININTADAVALSELNGIGPAKATAIVDYRKQHGPFKSVEQLADVKGIGEGFIAKNRDRITVR